MVNFVPGRRALFFQDKRIFPIKEETKRKSTHSITTQEFSSLFV